MKNTSHPPLKFNNTFNNKYNKLNKSSFKNTWASIWTTAIKTFVNIFKTCLKSLLRKLQNKLQTAPLATIHKSFKGHIYITETFYMAYRNSWTLDASAGRLALDAGCWTLDAGLRRLDSTFWTLALDAGDCCWLVQNRIRTQFLIILG